MVGTATDALDAAVLRAWADGAVQALAVHRGELDALNVFPVADSDTGTNLYLTLREALDAVTGAGSGATDRVAARELARGALVGARGNSGVIVSQYIGALLRGLHSDLTPGLLAGALRTATDAAYRAVANPVEGTVLTVARAVSDGAAAAVDARATRLARDGTPQSTLGVLDAAIDAGYAALARTTRQLAALRAAGVLDAGAWGLLLVLDALAEALHGSPPRAPRPQPVMPRRHGPCTDGADLVGGEFEVMYLVVAEAEPEDAAVARDVADALAATLSAVGDSVAVVGGDGLWQAHVHTDTPLEALDAAAVTGLAPTQVRVRHLASQAGVHGTHRPPLGLVAVTGSPALIADLARAGAVVVLVPEGRMAGPELGRAIDDTGARTVLVLAADTLLETSPDSGAHGPQVTSVDGLSEVQVVAGAATLASLDPALGEERIAQAVLEAVAAVRTATVAVGPGGHADRAADAARTLLGSPTSLLTVLTSAGTPPDVVGRLVAEAEAAQVEVVVLPTGAPGDQVVLGAE